MISCINCSKEIDSLFCPDCGQKNPVKKINLANMSGDFLSRVYGFDGMFPRTLRDLTLRPGEASREYIRGNRVKYYGPVGYFFLMITVYLLLASVIGVDLAKFMEASNPATAIQQGAGQQEINRLFMNWINDNLRLATFITAVFTVFFSWLYFKKSGYNIIESSVLIFYINGHLMWLTIISVLIYGFVGFAISFNYLLILTIVFMLFAYANFYTHQPRWKVVIKGLLSYISAYLVMILVVMLVFMYLVLTDKEFYEKIRPKNNKPTTEQSPSK